MEIAREHQYLEDWSDWELISVPMLDTAFDRSEKQAIRAGVIVGQPPDHVYRGAAAPPERRSQVKARFAYPLVFLLPSAMAAIVVAVVAGAAAGGILWLFVYGDSTWPAAADHAVVAFAGVVAAAIVGMLSFAAYSFGKARESRGGLSMWHVVFAAIMSVLLPALVLFHQWQIGNLGPQPVQAAGGKS